MEKTLPVNDFGLGVLLQMITLRNSLKIDSTNCWVWVVAIHFLSDIAGLTSQRLTTKDM